MKLLHAVFAGLLGLAATSGVAEAQWTGDQAPAWRDGRHDRRADRDGAYGYGWAASGRLARAAHSLAEESAAFADALHAMAPRSAVARDAMGVALVAARFHDLVESGAPPARIERALRRVRREMRQLAALTGNHPARGRFPQLEVRLARMFDAFEVTLDAARTDRGARNGRWLAGPVPPAYVAPAPVVRARPAVRPRYQVRVGF